MTARTYGGANGATYGEESGYRWSDPTSPTRSTASGGSAGGSSIEIERLTGFAYGGTFGATYGGLAGAQWSEPTAVERAAESGGAVGGSETARTATYERAPESGSTGGSEITRTAVYERSVESGGTVGGSEAILDLDIATEDISDRLNNSLKTPWAERVDGQNTHFAALFEAVAFEIALLRRTRVVVQASKYIENARKGELDLLGEQLNVERNVGETDDQYRTRIRTAFSAALSSATTPELIQTVETILGSDTAVAVNQVSTPATVELELDQAIFRSQTLTASEFVDRLDPLTAGGVQLQTLLTGTFQFVSGDTAVSSSDGFATLDNNATDGSATKDDIIDGSGGSWTNLRRS